jgi:hypothetical protein
MVSRLKFPPPTSLDWLTQTSQRSSRKLALLPKCVSCRVIEESISKTPCLSRPSAGPSVLGTRLSAPPMEYFLVTRWSASEQADEGEGDGKAIAESVARLDGVGGFGEGGDAVAGDVAVVGEGVECGTHAAAVGGSGCLILMAGAVAGDGFEVLLLGSWDVEFGEDSGERLEGTVYRRVSALFKQYQGRLKEG